MDLKFYLFSKKIKQKEFAKQLGITETVMNQYVHKRHTPRLAMAQKIIDLTNGSVTICDLIVDD